MAFTENVLHALPTNNAARAVILGLWPNNILGPETARAFLRHAFGCFYDDFSKVDLSGHIFLWQVTFRTALFSFRSAALRRAQQVKLQYVHRTYSSLHECVPKKERDRFNTVVDISLTGIATIHSAFQRAIDKAIDAAATRINRANPAPNPHQNQNRARAARC